MFAFLWSLFNRMSFSGFDYYLTPLFNGGGDALTPWLGTIVVEHLYNSNIYDF